MLRSLQRFLNLQQLKSRKDVVRSLTKTSMGRCPNDTKLSSLDEKKQCFGQHVVQEMNEKFANPFVDLSHYNADRDNVEAEVKLTEYQSPLQRLYRKDTVAPPFFNLDDICKNHEDIQKNLNIRKASRVDVKGEIVDAWERIKLIEKESDKLNKQMKDLFSNNRIEEGKEVKKTRKYLRLIEHKIKARMADSLMKLPNKTHKNALKSNNCEVIEMLGQKPDHVAEDDFLDHVVIGEKLGIFRRKRMHEFTGSRNYFLVGKGAELEQALIQFVLEKLKSKSFTMLQVPNILSEAVFDGAGMPYQSFDKLVYQLDDSINRLSGTSEVGICSYFANHAVGINMLPKRLTAVTTCYRKETDSRNEPKGLYRVHQFNKVEMFSVCTSQQSNEVLMEFVEVQKEIINDLNLHARVLEMPAHELGLPAHRKIDIEVWMPGRNGFGEVSSASNCTDYQARRLHIATRDRAQNYQFAHTVNATACATTRLIVAILEQGQQKDNTVRIPQCLVPYMSNKSDILRKEKFKMEYIGLKQSRKKQRYLTE